ncbi:MAG: hypothetical protein KC635_23980 [Myxococcales bacterium]|nr:hypothetical protein [Myxococcales bacterium]
MDEAVAFLNGAALRSGLELAAVVSAYVLDRFFGGSFEAFADPSRAKPLSFMALVRRADLAWSHASLYAFVRVGRQLAELPLAVAERLSVRHHRALLVLEDVEEKAAFAREALERGWSSEELEVAVRARRPASNRGRRPLPPVLKEFRAARRILTRVEDEVPVAELSSEQREELAEVLEELSARIGVVRAALDGGEAAA